jgi:succinate-semialdehyde dehydrogenase
MENEKYVVDLIARARKAQQIFEGYAQQDVDECVKAIGKAVYDNAEELARLAVEETGMGNYADKVAKNKGKPKATWYKLKGKKSRGILRYIEDEGIVEIAKPIGVLGAVAPATNPNMTPVHNAMVALKAGNAIIICPHPRGKKSGARTVELMRQALGRVGAPEDLILSVGEPTVEISALIMKLTDACISTGGPGMVKAAYSSGKPAYGVGPGNVQCLIDRDADVEQAVQKIIIGRTYDNGVLCSCEQSIFCPKERYDEIIAGFIAKGAFHVTGEDVARLRDAAFRDGVINKDFVGASTEFIAEQCGLTIPGGTRLFVVDIENPAPLEPLGKEKLFPVLTAYAYDKWEDAVNMAAANLMCEGKGHSCVIHSNTKENVEYASLRLPVARVAINQTGSNSLGGTLTNGLNPTATLGCGSWGNNSLSENLWYHHLMNITRIAYPLDIDVPTDEEIWA